jgi:hypothetical protein
VTSDFPSEPIKDEMRFFMEKGFQASFGYLTAMLAFLAISNTQFIQALAQFIHTSLPVLLSLVILLLNLTYLIIACTCLFAILKRGLFIILNAQSSAGAAWEKFVRESDLMPISNWRVKALTWNIDNYYMAPLLVLIFLVSTSAGYIGVFSKGSDVVYRILAGLLFFLHVIPAYMLWALAKMNSVCRLSIHRMSFGTSGSPSQD